MIVRNDNQVYAYISLELLVEETEVSTGSDPATAHAPYSPHQQH